jgi:hypothetical protein
MGSVQTAIIVSSRDRVVSVQGRNQKIHWLFHPHALLAGGCELVPEALARLIWVSSYGWLRWDGRRWTKTGAEDKAKIGAQFVARSIQREAAALRRTADDAVLEVRSPGAKCEREIKLSDKLTEWGRESESDRHLTAMAKGGLARMNTTRRLAARAPVVAWVPQTRSCASRPVRPVSRDNSERLTYSCHKGPRMEPKVSVGDARKGLHWRTLGRL